MLACRVDASEILRPFQSVLSFRFTPPSTIPAFGPADRPRELRSGKCQS